MWDICLCLQQDSLTCLRNFRDNFCEPETGCLSSMVFHLLCSGLSRMFVPYSGINCLYLHKPINTPFIFLFLYRSSAFFGLPQYYSRERRTKEASHLEPHCSASTISTSIQKPEKLDLVLALRYLLIFTNTSHCLFLDHVCTSIDLCVI